ncbi:O-acetyl-ADP-ribose deacetylase (regulator of RNase III), contains Macro domain [Alcanivorax sp. DSM 26293]|jgi:O-acetyl-ADP-ribose deacetylase (regulator of RNase III)|uniref:macro domain-containing protein n=1 Tax=unclassified Alcanivorax TaxID=2638842 RepID=UPI000789D501|nr:MULTISPECIES: macro domain-containing protein [unclassified Alcanivorax]MBU83487.1 macro domain-containing protein [Alcanivorax sp.]MEE2601561.1 macro domain-containing protein [Pseudomonadota bacterium]MEE3388844.1 macro domain-containing protein [Pseudomonadota bacterium]SEF85312.1 O-acetyl-ADP-ribose deacetylase (regulator of RNase III), contains Macro domain [Alcanivorax sp. DSM 26293]|tara:strand:- start:415 stop:945 length:531 start_codon:yes stop_codon:yes gene_type:complete
MTQRQFDAVTVETVQGDIANQPDLDAIVNAANAELRIGGGVAGAIHRAAGPGLEQECIPLGPIRPGDAVISAGHNLPNAHVIHCLGPVYGRDEPSDQLLASCYRQALMLADRNGIAGLGFPAISTGIFGYPLAEAAQVALQTVRDTAPTLETVQRVRFVLFSDADLAVFDRALKEL